MKLADYIVAHQFRQFILKGTAIDTRPFAGVETKPAKPVFKGLAFTGFGFKAVTEPGKPAEVKVLDYLPVGHSVAGATAEAAGNWGAMLQLLPPDTKIYVDEWTESNQFVGTVVFARDTSGTWDCVTPATQQGAGNA